MARVIIKPIPVPAPYDVHHHDRGMWTSFSLNANGRACRRYIRIAGQEFVELTVTATVSPLTSNNSAILR
jgi:hypothetical protein